MVRRLVAFASLGLLAGLPSASDAQNITVQQPVIRSFGVGTVVSVPDSGRGFLGRVARAGDSRGRYGSLPRGSSIGSFREHAGMSVHARIHDFAEMDERLLREGRNSARIPTGRRLSGNAEHAYRSLIGRYESRASAPRRPTATRNENSGGDTAGLFYGLGLRAEARGHHSLAQRHFRIAARHGSAAAKRRLSATRLAARTSR